MAITPSDPTAEKWFKKWGNNTSVYNPDEDINLIHDFAKAVVDKKLSWRTEECSIHTPPWSIVESQLDNPEGEIKKLPGTEWSYFVMDWFNYALLSGIPPSVWLDAESGWKDKPMHELFNLMLTDTLQHIFKLAGKSSKAWQIERFKAENGFGGIIGYKISQSTEGTGTYCVEHEQWPGCKKPTTMTPEEYNESCKICFPFGLLGGTATMVVTPIMTPAAMIGITNDSVIQFGDYGLEVRGKSTTSSLASPGLRFLVGIKTAVLDALPADSSVLGSSAGEAHFSNVNIKRSLKFKIGRIKEDCSNMAKILRFYDSVHKEMPKHWLIPQNVPTANDTQAKKKMVIIHLKDIADHIEAFGDALIEMAGKSTGSPTNILKDLDVTVTSPESETYANEFPTETADTQTMMIDTRWGEDKNILEVILKKDLDEVAFVSEYVPAGKFADKPLQTSPGLSAPGKTYIARLASPVKRPPGAPKDKSSKIHSSRIMLEHLKAFKNNKSVQNRTVVYFLSQIHEYANAVNNPAFQAFLSDGDGEALKEEIDFTKFIKDYIQGGWGARHMPLTVYFSKETDPVAQQKALARKEEKRGTVQTDSERNQHLEDAFEPSWYEKYGKYGLSAEATIDASDSTMGDILGGPSPSFNRLRLGKYPNYLSGVYSYVLNRADVKSLAIKLIRCMAPDRWLELACRWVFENTPIESILDNLRKSGALDQLLAVSDQITEAVNEIEKQRDIQDAEYANLSLEKEQYDNEIRLLSEKKAEIEDQAKIDEIDARIEELMGLRRQVEMDEYSTKYNSSLAATGGGVLPPIPQEELNVAKNSSKAISSAILDLKDPAFKEKICKEILKHAMNAAEFLSDQKKAKKKLHKVSEELKKGDKSRLERPKAPDMPTDPIMAYAIELLRKFVAQAIATIILEVVRKILKALWKACKQLQDDLFGLRDDDPNRKGKLPGAGNFKDLLAENPNIVSQDMAAALDDIGISPTPTDVGSLLDLMSDLELLLSEIEICALFNGQPSAMVICIVRNLLKIKYNDNIYAKLTKAGSKFASDSVVTEFFKQFGRFVEPGYCEDLQSAVEDQTYGCCVPIPSQDLARCQLQEGWLSKEECQNLIDAADQERYDTLALALDLATGNFDIPQPPTWCDESGQGVLPHDVQPLGNMQSAYLDQIFGPIDAAFKAEFQTFATKYVSQTKEPDLFAAFVSDDQTPGEKIGAGIDNATLEQIAAKAGADFEAMLLPKLYLGLINFAESVLSAPDQGTILLQDGANKSIFSDSTYRISHPWGGSIIYQLSTTDINKYIVQISWEDQDGKEQFFSCIGNTTGGVSWSSNDLVKFFKSLTTAELDLDISDSAKQGLTTSSPFGGSNSSEGFAAATGTGTGTGAGGKTTTSSDTVISSPLVDKLLESVVDLDPLKDSWDKLLSAEGIASFGGIFPDEVGKLQQNQTDVKNFISKIYNKTTVSILQRFAWGLSLSRFFKGDRAKVKTLLASMTPLENFSIYDNCFPSEDSSLLRVKNIKQYVKDRNKSLSCATDTGQMGLDPSPINEAAAEGIVLSLIRLYGVELAMRVMPLLWMIKADDAFKEGIVVELMVTIILTELAILDKEATNVTTTNLYYQQQTSHKAELYDSEYWGLTTKESPPQPAAHRLTSKLLKGGAYSGPKFPKHVIRFANQIMKNRALSLEQQGQVLVDPYNDSQEYSSDEFEDAYGLNGIRYLLKEQIKTVGTFIKTKMKTFLNINIQESIQETWLKMLDYEDVPDFPSDWEFAGGSQLVANLMPTGDSYELEGRFFRFVNNEAGFEPTTLHDRLKDGGFMLQPYIKAKFKSNVNLVGAESAQIGDFDLATQEKFKQEVYIERAQHFGENPHLVEAVLYPEYLQFVADVTKIYEGLGPAQRLAAKAAGTWPPADFHGTMGVYPAWKLDKTTPKAQAMAMQYAESALVAKMEEFTFKIDEPLDSGKNKHGNLHAPGGVYFNLEQWHELFGSNKFRLWVDNNNKSDELASKYFDYWTYGLRLVYVLPVEPSGATSTDEETSSDLNDWQDWEYNIWSKFPSGIPADALPGGAGKIYPASISEANVGFTGPTQADQHLFNSFTDKVKQKKSYMVHERVLGLDENAIFGPDQRHDFVTHELPFVEVEMPVLEDLDISLKYFTAFNTWENYPHGTLHKKMLEHPGFKKFFQNTHHVSVQNPLGTTVPAMFDLTNITSLITHYTLLNSFSSESSKFENMFRETKHLLRRNFYSIMNCQKFDQREDSALTEWNPAWQIPNIAKYIAMTPLEILKAIVDLIDPTWKDGMCWTVPGCVMKLLDKLGKNPKKSTPQEMLEYACPKFLPPHDQKEWPIVAGDSDPILVNAMVNAGVPTSTIELFFARIIWTDGEIPNNKITNTILLNMAIHQIQDWLSGDKPYVSHSTAVEKLQPVFDLLSEFVQSRVNLLVARYKAERAKYLLCDQVSKSNDFGSEVLPSGDVADMVHKWSFLEDSGWESEIHPDCDHPEAFLGLSDRFPEAKEKYCTMKRQFDILQEAHLHNTRQMGKALREAELSLGEWKGTWVTEDSFVQQETLTLSEFGNYGAGVAKGGPLDESGNIIPATADFQSDMTAVVVPKELGLGYDRTSFLRGGASWDMLYKVSAWDDKEVLGKTHGVHWWNPGSWAQSHAGVTGDDAYAAITPGNTTVTVGLKQQKTTDKYGHRVRIQTALIRALEEIAFESPSLLKGLHSTWLEAGDTTQTFAGDYIHDGAKSNWGIANGNIQNVHRCGSQIGPLQYWSTGESDFFLCGEPIVHSQEMGKNIDQYVRTIFNPLLISDIPALVDYWLQPIFYHHRNWIQGNNSGAPNHAVVWGHSKEWYKLYSETKYAFSMEDYDTLFKTNTQFSDKTQQLSKTLRPLLILDKIACFYPSLYAKLKQTIEENEGDTLRCFVPSSYAHPGFNLAFKVAITGPKSGAKNAPIVFQGYKGLGKPG